MATYTIGEVAEQSGFTASALRYYEGIGLVVPSGRTDAGYRLYDDGTLARLAFIARAKQLGCTLEEILDLAGLWDGDRCGPVQRRFHELVTAKMAAAEASIAELAAFRSQLRVAATGLAGEPVDGPCSDGCACVAAPAAVPVPAPVLASIPVACTLEPGERPGREAAWEALAARASTRMQLPGGGIRLEFPGQSVVADLADLVAAEQSCCTFFSFAITVDARGTGLEVRAPEEATPLVEALFAGR
ncbi:MAG TPA: MerR family transcriptional regulator [Acidimicrobiales bacterium]|nr:MerR family transcriptional regulator [Acidimicrobiales bacterium]